MPSEDELTKCLEHHLPYEINLLRVAARGLSEVEARGMSANIFIEVFCVHARNLIEFFDGRWAQSDDFTASQFAGYTCKVDLKEQRQRINKRISHLTTERVRGDDNKISHLECLRTYVELENEIERFMEGLTPQMRSALPARFNIPRQKVMVAKPDSMEAVDTTNPIAEWPSHRGDDPAK